MPHLLIAVQITLLLYHQVTTLFHLYPFNNVRRYSISERVAESTINGLLMALPPIGFALDLGWMKTAALVIYGVLLLSEYLTWWHPYFFGATASWRQQHQKHFRHTIIILPPIKNNPVPNLEHCVLHALTLLAAVYTYIYFLRS